jgi:hypothetical protein
MMVCKRDCALFAALLLIAVVVVNGQTKKKRLQPGKLYDAGEVIYAPRYGFTSVIPTHWEGTLPREVEIFLLVPDTISVGGEIWTFASEKNDLQSLKKNWTQGMNLSETIAIKATNIVEHEDMIASEVVPAGHNVNKGNKGYAIARCSAFGNCITCLGIGPVQCYEDLKTAVESFMNKASFSKPANISIYADFHWKEFLSNKTLITIAGTGGPQTGSKENTFNLCSDGSFRGYIKKKGIMKEVNSSYKGNQSGTWSTESIGDNGILKLNFKKLSAVELPISIKEDQIFINGERYFAAESSTCKK